MDQYQPYEHIHQQNSGATSGIGLETAIRLAESGIHVTAAGRRKEKLIELQNKISCDIIEIDVREQEKIYSEFGELEVDILINNAGVGKGFSPIFLAEPDDINTTTGSIKLGFDTFDYKTEEAAYINGASKLDCFISITLPQILPSIITGVTLAFARCLAEFGATITFVSNIPSYALFKRLCIFTSNRNSYS